MAVGAWWNGCRAFETWLEYAGSAFPAAECAAGWMRNAEGFYSAAEAESVRMLAEAYVTAILRKPEARMDYCA